MFCKISGMEKKSFVKMVRSKFEAPDYNICFSKTPSIWRQLDIVHFSKEEINELACPFEFTLVKKFSSGRPSLMSILKTIQNNLDLARNVYPSALNYRYILL
jgi:hypothetical protein